MVNGAQALRSTGIPTVADRTEPSTAGETSWPSTSVTAGSLQIGSRLR
ncbi:Uncharacterised protein [Mycobacteroides abscessus subsp. abscessus]|nr:Uncharacterised protein [Mycobacteroides abscessus subsp. abscessus]